MMARKNSYGRSTAGVELTDDVLEQMAQEAEAGLDITKLRRRPGRPAMGSGPAETLPVRLDPELRKALDDRAVSEETTASHVVREALSARGTKVPTSFTAWHSRASQSCCYRGIRCGEATPDSV